MVHHIPNDLKFVKLTFCVPRNRSRVILLFINSVEHSHETLRQEKKEKKKITKKKKRNRRNEENLSAFFRVSPRFSTIFRARKCQARYSFIVSGRRSFRNISNPADRTCAFSFPRNTGKPVLIKLYMSSVE